MVAEAESSVVELVDQLIRRAVLLHASDIHLECQDGQLRIRLRIDGVLYDQPSFSASIMYQIISRIKVLSGIDIAQKRIPQDGKFSITAGTSGVDLRVSTFPSTFGEKIVIRILDTTKPVVSLDQLGFSQHMLIQFQQLLKKLSGFILVTGPTGSGKTTTLYAALSALNTPTTNIITLEDPVEYNIAGITQGQINPSAGFTFAKGIRSLLRQDPDIAMIGEIRDKESARIAIEAALTGHLVFSTLHTNDAPSAIMRLMDMGIEPFLINAAITGVLAQRLVRTICGDCKIDHHINTSEQEHLLSHELSLQKAFKGNGCSSCNNLGYKGRAGIFELLLMTDQLRSLIVENPKFDPIKNQAIVDGMQMLKQDALAKVRDGITSLEELMKILS